MRMIHMHHSGVGHAIAVRWKWNGKSIPNVFLKCQVVALRCVVHVSVLNGTDLSLFLWYPTTRRQRTAWYKTQFNIANWHSYGTFNTTALWHHQFAYIHVWAQLPWNSVAIRRMRKQCLPGALLPPPPPRLRMRLGGPCSPSSSLSQCKVWGGCCTLSTRWCRAEVYADIGT